MKRHSVPTHFVIQINNPDLQPSFSNPQLSIISTTAATIPTPIPSQTVSPSPPSYDALPIPEERPITAQDLGAASFPDTPHRRHSETSLVRPVSTSSLTTPSNSRPVSIIHVRPRTSDTQHPICLESRPSTSHLRFEDIPEVTLTHLKSQGCSRDLTQPRMSFSNVSLSSDEDELESPRPQRNIRVHLESNRPTTSRPTRPQTSIIRSYSSSSFESDYDSSPSEESESSWENSVMDPAGKSQIEDIEGTNSL